MTATHRVLLVAGLLLEMLLLSGVSGFSRRQQILHHPTRTTSSTSSSSTSRSTVLRAGFGDSLIIQAAVGACTYFGFVAYCDRPRGELFETRIQVQASTVPGAGLGLFATEQLPQGTVLGTYPGVVAPLIRHQSKLRDYPACEGYIWRFSDNADVIDPTNAEGVCDELCVGGNPAQFGSLMLFQLLPMAAPTTLCRINEPPKGRDVNVVTVEDLKKRTVMFQLERTVQAGEEFFIGMCSFDVASLVTGSPTYISYTFVLLLLKIMDCRTIVQCTVRSELFNTKA
jgi:hypothetical protein